MCGNSLIHRFALDTPFKNVLRHYNKESKTNLTLDDYRQWVYDYTNLSDHTQKDKFRQKIEEIKHAFKTELSDGERGKLSYVRGEIDNLQAKDIFGKQTGSAAEIKKMQKKLKDLEAQRDDIYNNKLYENAFEWRFEFPALLDEDGNFTGFDVVIGNPPYVQLQADKGKLAKLYESFGFKTFNKGGDIYCLFYEKGFCLLKTNGCLCYITSNKWMRTGYGKELRRYLTENTNSIILIDFGETHIFETATVMTNILVSQNASNKNHLVSTQIKEDFHNPSMLRNYVVDNNIVCKFANDESWVIMPDEMRNLKKFIESKGKPLEKWDIQINYGIKTGYNKAFIIDTETRNKILANCCDKEELKRTENIICPILRGKDIRKYGHNWNNSGKYLINTHNGVKGCFDRISIEDYPALKNFLDKFVVNLTKRSDKGDTPYNLRNCAYLEDFNTPKIMYPNMTKYMPFYYDQHNFFTNDKGFIITGKHISYLTAFLNSSLFKYFFIDNFPPLFGGARELRKIFVEKIPVLEVDDKIDAEFHDMVVDIQNEYSDAKARIIDQHIFDLYGLSQEDRKKIGYIDFHGNVSDADIDEGDD